MIRIATVSYSAKRHSVEAYYAVLAAKGFLDLEDIKAHFSKNLALKYIGHPNNKLPGIEMNSGSLGHGLPVCVAWLLQAKKTTEIIVFTPLWVMANWQRVCMGGLHGRTSVQAGQSLRSNRP